MNKVQLLPLKNQLAFDLVSKQAAKFSSPLFVIFLSTLPAEFSQYSDKILRYERKPVCYGFKISKKIGKSHERNLIKRRLKNIYIRYFQKQYSRAAVMFIPKKLFKELDFQEIEREIERALKWCIKKLSI